MLDIISTCFACAINIQVMSMWCELLVANERITRDAPLLAVGENLSRSDTIFLDSCGCVCEYLCLQHDCEFSESARAQCS